MNEVKKGSALNTIALPVLPLVKYDGSTRERTFLLETSNHIAKQWDKYKDKGEKRIVKLTGMVSNNTLTIKKELI